MKKIKITLLLLLSFCFSVAQHSQIDNNIVKYWNYRERLVNNFIAIGSESGQSLPFGTRNEREFPRLEHGEGPIMLGQYLGVLATEYKLLKKNNSNTTQTLKELYYALYAFNRLDLIAETVNGYNKKPKLDGFFVREDFPDDFVKKNPALNKHSINTEKFIYGSGKTFHVKCTNHKGTQCCDVYVDKNCNVKENPKGYAKKYNHVPMSMDQILGVLLGVSLVNELVDDNASYQNKLFQDNENKIKQEAKNIAERIISYAKKYHWTPKDPDGDYNGDCDFRGNASPNYFKNNTTMLVFSRFFSKIGTNIFGKKYTYIPLIDFLDGVGSIQADNFKGDFWNRRMYIEMITLSNRDNNLFLSTGKKVLKASKKYNWEPYYYNLGVILHDWKRNKTIEKKGLEMLNSAPFNGPFYHGITDFSKYGWATKNRFSASLGEQYNGWRFPEITGNYIGLDYMLLHNMYLLVANKSESFAQLKNKKQDGLTKIVASKLSLKKCIQSEKQSCVERKKYYQFLEKYKNKNCKDSRVKCKEKTVKYFKTTFGNDNGPNMKCSKSVYIEKCTNPITH